MMDGGILLIDKPSGPTSHDVVHKIRKKLKTKRVGHAGTLDPLATGLLVVCVGGATRLLEYMTATEKMYTGEVVFGIGTDTDDASGNVIATGSAASIDDAQLAAAVQQLTGTIVQKVPAYSAVHVNGKRAYELARAGEDVEMPSREVHIHSFSVDALTRDGQAARAAFAVRCSKGTYIRALCRDLGGILGVPAHMASLRRTAVGPAQIAEAVDLDAFMRADDASLFLQKPISYLTTYPKLEVTTETLIQLANGQRANVDLVPDMAVAKDDVLFVCHADELAAVAEVTAVSDQLELQPKKVFWKRG
ncbi:tRNA pseudouridine(55) synthase TruB [Alicyclobacillus fodiniaquatilis]|jgi:tRNA pseudouridine55 synthase|uniref:tRNA pseudouridine synthase B n=1 Tax=Alicyclobacillus fodiniaquatilis TaxID=1661150 RepID=A0ABW4JG72_9BACL